VLGWRIQSILTIHATKFSPATPLFDPTEGGSCQKNRCWKKTHFDVADVGEIHYF
jgi:hypothetical protein